MSINSFDVSIYLSTDRQALKKDATAKDFDISFVFATAFLHDASLYHVENVIAVDAVDSSSYREKIPSYVMYGNAGFVGAEYIAFSSYAGKNCEKKF